MYGQICKDKDEAEVWFVGLKALITRGSYRRLRTDSRSDCVSSDSPRVRRVSPSRAAFVSSNISVCVCVCVYYDSS